MARLDPQIARETLDDVDCRDCENLTELAHCIECDKKTQVGHMRKCKHHTEDHVGHLLQYGDGSEFVLTQVVKALD